MGETVVEVWVETVVVVEEMAAADWRAVAAAMAEEMVGAADNLAGMAVAAVSVAVAVADDANGWVCVYAGYAHGTEACASVLLLQDCDGAPD